MTNLQNYVKSFELVVPNQTPQKSRSSEVKMVDVDSNISKMLSERRYFLKMIIYIEASSFRSHQVAQNHFSLKNVDVSDSVFNFGSLWKI